MTAWPMVHLKDILNRSNEWTNTDPNQRYRQVAVRLWGKGATLRNEVSGAEIAGERRFVVREKQLLLSRIDARNGAIAVVPLSLDGAVVSNDFPTFDIDQNRAEPEFLGWMCHLPWLWELCRRASEGTTNRIRLVEHQFLGLQVSLPPLAEQRRLVARIEQVAAKVEEAQRLRRQTQEMGRKLLLGVCRRITRDASQAPMSRVAPQVRRPIVVYPNAQYLEIGVRSFGNGTFHKPPVSGLSLGDKRVFEIRPCDLVFSNVFAWEGAIAVATPDDSGRVGSHRFITCTPQEDTATLGFLCFHFLTSEGLRQLGQASPGGAGRNRTLGLDALNKIMVPVPPFEQQLWFDQPRNRFASMNSQQAHTDAMQNTLLPSVLDRAFRGEL